MDSDNSPYPEVRLEFQAVDQSPMGFNRKRVKQRRQSTNPGTGTHASGSASNLNSANFYSLLKRQN